MSTLQTTTRHTRRLRTALTATAATLAVLTAIAIATVVVAPQRTNTANPTPGVATASDTSAVRPTSAPPANRVTANNGDISAYIKAALYNQAR
jgi:hypothetical protein